MLKKQTLEEWLLTPVEIEEEIAKLKQQKLKLELDSINENTIHYISEFKELSDDEIFDYQTFYEVSDIKNKTVYYLNGVQVASLFGLNEEYKKQFLQKSTDGRAQLNDRLIRFYYREEV